MSGARPLRTPGQGDAPASNVTSWEAARRQYRAPTNAPGPPKPPPPTKPPPSKKHRSKRFNEQLKAFYGYMNALAVAVIVAGFITPTVRHEQMAWDWDTAALFLVSIVIHCVGQAALFILTRPEE